MSISLIVLYNIDIYQSRFLGRGCDEALFSEEKGFSVKRGEAIQWNRGLVRIYLRERQFSEEVRAIHWTAGLWKLKSCCPHPLPENRLLIYIERKILREPVWQVLRVGIWINGTYIRADFQEGDEDSNFSVFRVRRFTESPGPLHWIAFPVEILTKPPIHWIASPLSLKNPFFTQIALSYPLPKNQLLIELPRIRVRKSCREAEISRNIPGSPRIGKRLWGNRSRGQQAREILRGLGSLRGSLRRPQSLSEEPSYWRIGHRMHLSEVSWHPLRDPLRVPFSSQSCGFCCP